MDLITGLWAGLLAAILAPLAIPLQILALLGVGVYRLLEGYGTPAAA